MKQNLSTMLRRVIIGSSLVLGGCLTNTSELEDPEVLGTVEQRAVEDTLYCKFSTDGQTVARAGVRVVIWTYYGNDARISIILPRNTGLELEELSIVGDPDGSNITYFDYDFRDDGVEPADSGVTTITAPLDRQTVDQMIAESANDQLFASLMFENMGIFRISATASPSR